MGQKCMQFKFASFYFFLWGENNNLQQCVKGNVRIFFWNQIFAYLFSNFSSCGNHQKHGVLQGATPQLKHITLVSFLHSCAEQTLHFLRAALFFSVLLPGGTWTILWISNPPRRRVAGSVTGGCLQSGGFRAVDVAVTDPPSPLPFSSSLSAGSVIFWTQSSRKPLKAWLLPL